MCEGVKKVSINGDIFSFFLFIFICGDKKLSKHPRNLQFLF